jgi:hypothetical protein
MRYQRESLVLPGKNYGTEKSGIIDLRQFSHIRPIYGGFGVYKLRPQIKISKMHFY